MPSGRDQWRTEIETLSESPESAFLDRETFDSNYFRLVSEASILLNQSRRRSSAASDDGSSSSRECRHDFVRLPKIDLPHFNGDYQHWLEFRDTYISLIHNNTTISEINKFHYLRAALKGAAALSIQSLEFSSNNYHLAWQLLTERYDNERLLVNHHIQALFNFENITKESSRLLRNMVDITNKNLRALALLGQPTDHWDTLIIYIMSKKLDPTISRQWEEYRNNINGIPNLQQYIKFINNRADLLEAVYDNNKSCNKQKLYHTSPDTHKNKLHKSPDNHTFNSSYKCPICSQAHFIFSCETFRKLDIESRIKRIKELNVCRNCLRPGHNHNQCRLTHCKYCNNKHNTLLHMSLESPKESEEMTLALSTQLSVNQGNQPTTLLSTALVRVADVHNKLHTARLLLDNGSTSNFVSRQFSERLGLVTRHVNSTVYGINCQSSLTSESCELAILSLCDNYEQNITCYVLPEITKCLPPTYIDIKSLHIPEGIRLADPTFNISSEIDILVGAEVFWKNLLYTFTTLTTNPSNSNPITHLIHKFSHINKIVRILSYVKRFIYNCRNKIKIIHSFPTYIELKSSLKIILHKAQREMFPEEYLTLKSKQNLPPNSKLISLSPFLDSDNLIRVGGRLNHSLYPYDVKHPILLCSKHHITHLIFRLQHKTLMHAGPQLLLANVRQTYWPINGRNLARKIVHSCVRCHRFKAIPIQPIMADLPKERTQLEFPFLISGIDYAGPVLIVDRKGRGSRLIKSYICVFICFAVKAVHLELVTDLTKEAFLAALNRFISRRGKPATIYSDNGTTFVGASNELARFLNNNSESLGFDLLEQGIKFKTIPAYSPHFGGIWEAAVKSVKYHLRRILTLAHLTYEEMSTCLVQVEAILNSRPLTPLSTDPSDLSYLCPSHFLIGRPLLSALHEDFLEKNINRLQRYQKVEKLRQHFWQRYSTEYISLLQTKTKWTHSSGKLEVGSLVLIKDRSQPPLL
ncbi:hypothetical protein K1T71_001630 [Dendrolimus kikuchii]|uniref:Uncharacterized protein n=1 Tax=Dendrolimus kikuchii TaxID=765133 RepID=A0ACC1DEH4_9NEOP|nr:hypothetical protein K1T71_001630 [Dendrolimus kikuchii]